MSTLSALVPVPVRYPMITWFTGDVFDGLATLDDGSIDLVVTSPPFLALRSYLPADHPDKDKEIGSEATPAEFLDVMLKVTAELRRVLAPHGSIAVELGDTYAGSGGAGGDYEETGLRGGQNHFDGSASGHRRAIRKGYGGAADRLDAPIPTKGDGWPLAKSKTLIPELYRIALAYGFNPLTGEESPAGRWRVRNVVTWCRPNPPVGALGDKWRPATSDVVVACVSGKRYWDDLATRKEHKRDYELEAASLAVRLDNRHRMQEENGLSAHPSPSSGMPNPAGAPLLDYWMDHSARQLRAAVKAWHEASNTERDDLVVFDAAQSVLAGLPPNADDLDYWEIPPTGYAGAHYAVYPPALVEPLVKAMVPERVCRTCGEPSRRIVETKYEPSNGHKPGRRRDLSEPEGNARGIFGQQKEKVATTSTWTHCGHDDWRPGIVLDPFAGSGTTLAVASGHGHDAIGFDLDPRNEELARERVGPLLWQEV